jgi:formylglycine-generating enzyme required for sulfatase activity
MQWIPGGTFRMGSNGHYPDEAPEREVYVDGFFIDRCAVTNREFARFVEATGYVTSAERPLDVSAYPGALPELLVPGSAVFKKPAERTGTEDCLTWWEYVPGACWRYPEGPGSTILDRAEHPVVHVTFEDAEAYAGFVGRQLPTEAEWERAARGGLEGAEFAWGDDAMPGGQPVANYWQGEFPWENLALDGFERTAPADAFPPNGFGLRQMIGNVWEWTADWYVAGQAAPGCCGTESAHGPTREMSLDPASGFPRKVLKGGSFLCAKNYCFRYRPAARFPQTIDTSSCHIGFRCVKRVSQRSSPRAEFSSTKT